MKVQAISAAKISVPLESNQGNSGPSKVINLCPENDVYFTDEGDLYLPLFFQSDQRSGASSWIIDMISNCGTGLFSVLAGSSQRRRLMIF
jgi:hypothetical protein